MNLLGDLDDKFCSGFALGMRNLSDRGNKSQGSGKACETSVLTPDGVCALVWHKFLPLLDTEAWAAGGRRLG